MRVGESVRGEGWNLLAASLCALAAAGSTALYGYLWYFEPTMPNLIATLLSGIGTAGGIAWIVAAAISLREP
jgi:hypothetical protein